MFSSRQLLLSLAIAFAIGGVAGVLASINLVGNALDKSTLITLVIAGYAGTDLIEGFLKKHQP